MAKETELILDRWRMTLNSRTVICVLDSLTGFLMRICSSLMERDSVSLRCWDVVEPSESNSSHAGSPDRCVTPRQQCSLLRLCRPVTPQHLRTAVSFDAAHREAIKPHTYRLYEPPQPRCLVPSICGCSRLCLCGCLPPVTSALHVTLQWGPPPKHSRSEITLSCALACWRWPLLITGLSLIG